MSALAQLTSPARRLTSRWPGVRSDRPTLTGRWGRRTGTLVILLVAIPLSILASFSTRYTMYTAIRTMVGFTFPALYQIPFILGE